jgi:hypothetical protein
MAAKVIARELRLLLYRIDLSAVLSRYIGETKKTCSTEPKTAPQSGLSVAAKSRTAMNRHANGVCRSPSLTGRPLSLPIATRMLTRFRYSDLYQRRGGETQFTLLDACP